MHKHQLKMLEQISPKQTMYMIITLLSLALVADAHLCLISPQQRGNQANLNKKAQDECFQIKGPCGQAAIPAYPRSQYVVGEGGNSNLTVVFQKNLDHFNNAKAGYFSVSLGKKPITSTNDITFDELLRIKDSDTPNLYIYEASIKLPKGTYPWYVLQVAYVTNNPSAPAAFYQCADFSVIQL